MESKMSALRTHDIYRVCNFLLPSPSPIDLLRNLRDAACYDITDRGTSGETKRRTIVETPKNSWSMLVLFRAAAFSETTVACKQHAKRKGSICLAQPCTPRKRQRHPERSARCFLSKRGPHMTACKMHSMAVCHVQPKKQQMKT